MSTATPSRPHLWLRWAAVVFVLAMVAARWDGNTGFSGLIRFGDEFSATRLPEVTASPVRSYPGHGYDGQFYAQMAVRLDPRDEGLQTALDNPRYRARRILLPAIAHALGAGNVALTLNIFALLNTAAWLLLAWRLWNLVSPDAHGTAVWLACMLSLGALDSVRESLTDLPALLLIVLAIEALHRNRPWPAAGLIALSALVRETGLLAAAVPSHSGWGRRIGQVALVVFPFAFWAVWVGANVSAGYSAGGGNVAGPIMAFARHIKVCSVELLHGNFDGRYSFGLLAAAGFAWQSIYLLHFFRIDSPWVRLGLPFAVIFWVLGDGVWHGYWAVARACLPLTFAFNFLLPHDRGLWPHYLLGNLTLLHGIWRMLP